MTDRPFITPQDISLLARPCYADEAKVLAYIYEAEQNNIKPKIGDDLFLRLKDGENPLLLDGGIYEKNGKRYYLNGIKKALAYYAYSRLLESGSVNLTRQGVVNRRSDDANAVNEDNIIKISRETYAIADRYMQEVMDYLGAGEAETTQRTSVGLIGASEGARQRRKHIPTVGGAGSTDIDLSAYATKDYVKQEISKINIPSLNGYATEQYVQHQVFNIEIQTGAFKLAQQKAKNNNGVWTWMLEEGEIKKPIWHIGDGNFIDAVGALIHFETEPELNVFQYTIVLDEDNATTYVPVIQNRMYNMVVDWGDGSEQQSYVQTGAYKGLSHSYTGTAGTKYQITLKGTGVDSLAFEDARTFNKSQLYSIDNNTLQYPTKFGLDKKNSFMGCVNLVSVSANALLNSVNNDTLSFSGCSSLKTLPVGILDNKELTTLSYFVGGCSVLELSEDFMNNLAQKISSATDFFYAFQGCKGKIHIPDNFFDNVNNGVTDVRSMTLNATGVTGDAKKLYDSLKTKMTTENVMGCFSGENLSNRDQVPTAWGGTMK